MSRFVGNNTPEEHAHLGTLNVKSGFAGGLGMVLSLFHKQVKYQEREPHFLP
jgi:hypothetical protein